MMNMTADGIINLLSSEDRGELRTLYLENARGEALNYDLEWPAENIDADYFQQKLQSQNLAIMLEKSGFEYTVEIYSSDKMDDFCPTDPFYLGQSIFAIIKDDFRREFVDFMVSFLLVDGDYDKILASCADAMEAEIADYDSPQSVVDALKERFDIRISDGYDSFSDFVVIDKTSPTKEVRKYLGSIGKKGGSSKSPKKLAAIRQNAKKGGYPKGRPRKQKDA